MKPEKPLLVTVDDEIEIAHFVSDTAKQCGFSTRVCSSVKEFTTLSKTNQPDIIVSDICMPDVDGIELIQQLSAVRSQAGIILMSGYHSQFLSIAEMLSKDYNLHYLGKIEKPFRLTELTELFQEAYKWVEQRGNIEA